MVSFREAMEEEDEPTLVFRFEVDGVGGVEGAATSEAVIGHWLLAFGALVTENGIRQALDAMGGSDDDPSVN